MKRIYPQNDPLKRSLEMILGFRCNTGADDETAEPAGEVQLRTARSRATTAKSVVSAYETAARNEYGEVAMRPSTISQKKIRTGPAARTTRTVSGEASEMATRFT